MTSLIQQYRALRSASPEDLVHLLLYALLEKSTCMLDIRYNEQSRLLSLCLDQHSPIPEAELLSPLSELTKDEEGYAPETLQFAITVANAMADQVKIWSPRLTLSWKTGRPNRGGIPHNFSCTRSPGKGLSLTFLLSEQASTSDTEMKWIFETMAYGNETAFRFNNQKLENAHQPNQRFIKHIGETMAVHPNDFEGLFKGVAYYHRGLPVHRVGDYRNGMAIHIKDDATERSKIRPTHLVDMDDWMMTLDLEHNELVQDEIRMLNRSIGPQALARNYFNHIKSFDMLELINEASIPTPAIAYVDQPLKSEPIAATNIQFQACRNMINRGDMVAVPNLSAPLQGAHNDAFWAYVQSMGIPILTERMDSDHWVYSEALMQGTAFDFELTEEPLETFVAPVSKASKLRVCICKEYSLTPERAPYPSVVIQNRPFLDKEGGTIYLTPVGWDHTSQLILNYIAHAENDPYPKMTAEAHQLIRSIDQRIRAISTTASMLATV